MVFKSRKKRKKADSKKSSSRSAGMIRNEIYGLLLITIGILLALSILSYHQSDPVGFLDEGNIFKVKNWMGIVGATIAAPLFQWTFGYPILVLPILITVIGFFLLLHLPLQKLVRFSAILTFWGIFLGTLLALPESLKTYGNVQSFYPSGFIGGILAAYLVKFFSKFGALFIIIVIFLMLLIVTFHLRISDFTYVFIEIIRKIISGLKEFFINIISRRKKVKFESLPKKISGLKPEMSLQEEVQDPFYQPTLPSEKDRLVIEPSEREEYLEIVHHEKISSSRDSNEGDMPDRLGEQSLVNSKCEDTKTQNQKEKLGFEIQEAHHEKELDYDSLVRDSLSRYQFPSTGLLIEDSQEQIHLSETELKNNARLLENTLAQFGVRATVNRVVEGPVITLYEVKPAQGVKISRIVSLADDLALAMRARGIRMIAPIPGKAAIGIEIPNRKPSTVYFRSIVRSETFINYRGGKSVGINTMIASLLYRVPPSDLKFVLIDPKKLELSIYAKLKDHYLAIAPELDEIVITHPQNAIMILRSMVNEMEERYDKLAALGVREITHYNRKIEEYQKNGETSEEFRKLPYIVIVIDELADLILSAARTQRPSVDIITGLIKANFPARIAYQVATRPDSKVILDMYGAEQLIGNGDMLFFPPGKVKPIRLQNALITTEEVERIIKHIRKQPKFPPYQLKLIRTRTTKGIGSASAFERDELFDKAKEIVIRYQQGSTSLLQRKLKIGYARAGRIMDQLEEAGIVGPVQDGKAREVLVSSYSSDTSE